MDERETEAIKEILKDNKSAIVVLSTHKPDGKDPASSQTCPFCGRRHIAPVTDEIFALHNYRCVDCQRRW